MSDPADRTSPPAAAVCSIEIEDFGDVPPAAEIADLPGDVIEYIFLHLTPYGDLQRCRTVCRAWNRLATGALDRLRRLHGRCDNFEWYLLDERDNGRGKIAERCSHAACYHSSGNMFVFGGCTAAYTTFNDLWRFDLATRSWSRAMPSGAYPTPKACATMVEYAGRLYLFGGWSKSSPNPIHQTAMFFNEMHVFDPATNAWTATNREGAPHLAGHSASLVGRRMVVFGGSRGNGSSNDVWLYDFGAQTWTLAHTNGAARPSARYGQSQVVLDDRHLVVVGGCGGPNMIFNDVWLLTIDWLATPAPQCTWVEVRVTNAEQSAPQLWSHAACQVADKMVVLSKRLRNNRGSPALNRPLSLSDHQHHQQQQSTSGTSTLAQPAPQQPGAGAGGKPFVPPQGNLIPPRRKLLTSRSLDEQEPPPSPSRSAADVRARKPGAELQRASSIPAIIVGEIPKLVVTKETECPACDNGIGAADQPSSSSSSCIALAASSLLPNQEATQVEPPSPFRPPPPRYQPDAFQPAHQRDQPSVKPNAQANRGRRLEILRRMEEHIRSQQQQPATTSAAAAERHCHHGCSGAAGGPTNNNSSNKVRFRPSSPPPKFKHRRPSDSPSASRNPMTVYVLELDKVLTAERSASWRVVDGPLDAPEDTILYSLVQARAELVMFGGMRSAGQSDQQLDVTPFTHMITNETYILRPAINL